MYYVAKMYEHVKPSVVEEFDNETLAIQYANIMNQAGKGKYIVLTQLIEKQ